jgi:hypothetical protein
VFLPASYYDHRPEAKHFYECLKCEVRWYDATNSVCWFCGTTEYKVLQYRSWNSAEDRLVAEMRARLREEAPG